MRARFNPLHCGAVVASTLRLRARHVTLILVSIPFIAGQWSLPHPAEGGMGESRGFQSPSLRGSGRFRQAGPPPSPRFNPLHCGAVVASPPPDGGGRGPPGGFNPLHCGAVVASRLDRRRRAATATGFNPLHCGAVVASPHPAVWRDGGRQVSIPFIAGQWSLPSPAALL